MKKRRIHESESKRDVSCRISICNKNQRKTEEKQKKTKKPDKPEKPMTFGEEIKKYPGRFERLTSVGWVTVMIHDSVSRSGEAAVLNNRWNQGNLDNKVFYVATQFGYKEIIRRRMLP